MSENETAVLAMEQQWAKANNANDTALEATLLAEKFINVGLDGKVSSRDQFLADEKATKYTHVAADNIATYPHGEVVIVTYGLTMKGTGSDSKPMDLRLRETDTWVKAPDGRWQCVAAVGSPIK